MDKPLFDSNTGMLLLDDYVFEMPSFKKMLEDDIITEDEIKEQSERVVALLKKLESSLPSESKGLLTETLCELAVLYAAASKSFVGV